MKTIRTRTPGWVMAATTVVLAVVISVSMGVIAAGAKKGGGPSTKVVRTTAVLPANNTFLAITAQCPKGYKVTGGGFTSDKDVGAGSSAPSGNGWRITAFGSSFTPGGSGSATAVAVCTK
jgi:hypothetical protein